ncbi:hypothetical protein [Micromonospora sp. NPDC004704]
MSRTEFVRVRPMRLLAVLAVLLAAVVVVLAPRPAPALADAAGVGGDFVAFPTPRAVLDTRTGIGGVTGVRGPASTTTFPVLGVNSIPASGVSAVLVRIAPQAATATTYLTLYPDGTTRPGTSNINVTAGQNISNTAITKVGANGRVAVYNSAGNTGILVEVQGYFTSTPGTTGGGLVPIPQTRIFDTRNGTGTTTGAMAAGASRTFTVTGAVVPAGAQAVYGTITVGGATAAGWLAAAPAGTTTGVGLLNYEDGAATNSGATFKLAADGRVTLINKGSSAVDVFIDLKAYFGASPTAGAGFRPVNTRVYDSRNFAQVGANATVDVQVAGTNGLPLRGVAAVAVDVESNSTGEGGFLKMWGVGDVEAPNSFANRAAGITRSALSFVKPGTDGKIRIRNSSNKPANLIVDLQGWFADPIPAVPVAQYAPTTVLQGTPQAGATASMIEYAYVDNIGRVVSGHQTDPDNFGSVQWTVLSGNEALTGRPALTQLTDGRVQLAAQHAGSNIWVNSQTAVNSATWKTFSDLGGSMAAPPAMTRLTTGTTVLFAVDVDGKLWTYAQTGAVPYWRNLGDQNLVGTPVLAAVNGGVQVFGVDTTGAVKTIRYATDGAVSAWTSLGGSGATGTPSVVLYPGYRLRVFVRAADGTIATKLQDATGGTWPATWTQVGTLAAAGAPAAILDPVLGRTAVVVRGTDDTIYRSFETAQGTGAFGEWAPVFDFPDPAATDPTVAPLTNVNGQTWIIVFRNLNNASRVYVASDLPAARSAGANAAGAKQQAAETDPRATTAPERTFRAVTLPAPPPQT